MDDDLAILEEGRSDWPLQTVDDVKAPGKGALISGPFGSNISAKYFTEEGVPVIRGNNLALDVGVRFKDEGFVFITAEKAEELGTWAQRGDLLFTAVGTIGQVGYLSGSESFPRYIISNKQIRLRIDTDKLLPLFAYYWFASPQVVDLIQQRNTGSSVPLINLTVVKSLPVPVPSIGVQEDILAVLSSLDAKIDLLHRQNKTLEAMAEALFRQWFVEEAEEGWEEVRLDQFSAVGIGRTPPRKEQHWFSTDGKDVKWISIKDMAAEGPFIFTTAEYLIEEAVERFRVPVIPQDTVVLSFKMTLGRVKITTEAMLSNEAIAHFRINADSHVTKEFLYLGLKTYPYESLGTTSTIVDSINSGMIKGLVMQVPPVEQMDRFMEQCGPWFEKIRSNQLQIQTLTALRDILLPKLMSGEVRVEQLDKALLR